MNVLIVSFDCSDGVNGKGVCWRNLDVGPQPSIQLTLSCRLNPSGTEDGDSSTWAMVEWRSGWNDGLAHLDCTGKRASWMHSDNTNAPMQQEPTVAESNGCQ